MEKHKFKISAPTWNAKFELPDGLYSVSDIQDYVESIIKKQETVTVNPEIKIYEKRIENKITFKINTRHYLELLTPETMKTFESNKSATGEILPHLKIAEVVLVHYNVASNDYQQDS